MFELLIIFHIISAILIIGLILLQQGKGSQTGAAFGSGASTTVFGSQGSGNFLSRTTAILVTIFFTINLGLAYLSNKGAKKATMQTMPVPVEAPISSPANTDVPDSGLGSQSDVPR